MNLKIKLILGNLQKLFMVYEILLEMQISLAKKIEISLLNKKNSTFIKIIDDGNGFPKDLIKSEKLGEPYIRTFDSINNSKTRFGIRNVHRKNFIRKKFCICKI